MAINKNEGLEDLKKNGWVPFSKQKYEIKDDAGNTVGTIGYKAAKALNNNKLFDYDPSNDEEKKVFSYLRQRHNRESRKREQREYYATAPYAVKSKAKKETESELFPSVRRPTISGETKNADVLNFRNRTDVKNKYNEIEREASKHRYSDNKVFTVPITQNKKINVKYGVMKKLDGIASRTDLSEYDRAKKMDEVIDQLGLSDDEKKNARSYAGIKKLELSSASNGEDSFLKEITQPIVKFLAGTRDAAESAARFFIKDGMKLDGSYTQAYNEAEKYYTENPDELGNDLFDNYKQGLSTPEGEYLRNAGVDKILEAYNDTTKASQFISDAGFRSAGQMAGDMALVQMAGVPNAMAAAKNIAGAAMSGTKAADTLSKVGNIAPKIKEVAGTGKVTKAANTIINGVNSVSVGKAVKFLNPLDNPTTALMGISAAQDKYSTLKRMGYDDETAKKSALFSGYVSTVTEKMGYDGKPESFFLHKGNPVAGSATASKAANAKKVLKDYLKANVGEGVEEIYNTVFDRAGDYFSKIGYVDENGKIKQRKVFGKEGIIDPGDIGENFLGGFVGGAVMGSAGVLSNIAQYDIKTVREYADDVRREVAHSNKVVTELAKEAGVENVNLPSEPNWEKASVDEINDYYSKAIDAHLALLNNEKVINHDAAEIQKAENLVITPDGDNARQSVLAAANSENTENSVISPSVTAAANVSERQMHDVKENLSEGGATQSVEQVQNAVKKVTNTMINEFKNSNIKNIPNYQAAYDENLRLSTTKGATIDKDFIKTYANQYAEGLKRNNSKAYKALASVSDDVGSMLTDYLISNRIPQGIGDISALAQAGGELRSIVGKAAQTTLAMNGKIYNDTDRVSAISNEISNGNFAVVDGANDGNIALAKVGEYYEAYGADAVALAKAFGVSTHYIQKNGRKTLVAAVPSKYIGEYAAKSGYSGTQYSTGGNEYIYLTKDAERGNLSADAVRSDITAESDSDFIAEIEKNGMIELDERPSESKIETIAAQVERDNTIPVYLDGVDKLGEVLLVYANEEDVTRNMVKTDINSYYDGVMPERGIPLSENTDRHYDEDTIEISERPSEYDADSYALVVELDRTIPILLNGVDELGEVELNYSNEENVTRDMIKSDIDAYYSGTMPEHGVSLSNNYDPDIKFSVESVDGTDKKYVKADRQVISGDNPEEWRKQVYNYINSSIRKGKDINVLSADGDVLTITEDTAGKARFRNTIREPNGNLRKMTNEEFAVKLRAESHIDEIAEVSKKNGYSAIDTKNHHFAKDGFYYRTAYFEDFDGKYYKLTLSVGKSGEINTVYNVGKLKETYGRARDSKVVEQKPNNARRGFSDEAVPFKTASETNIGLRGGTPSDNTNISQNDDIVNSNIRENSENDTENVKFSQDISLDGGGNIRYNDDIDIPYRESKQLREYIMSENNRNGSRLKPFGYKEIGDNFYFWRNNSKTDYDVIAQVEIDGNEDIIDLLRKGLENGKTYGIDKGAKGFNDWLTAVRSGQRSDSGNNAVDTAELSNGNDDRLYSRQSSDDDGIKFDRESNRNQQNTEVGNYGRDDILNGNDRRTFGESERERGSGVQEITGDASGNASEEQSSASTRGIYARDVKEAGGVERRNDRGVEADFVKSEYYNDEMRRIAAENDERGVVTHFILGNGRAIKYGTDFRGAVRGDEVYIQADHGKYSPTQINRHEITHRNYSTDTVQALKNRIKSRLTNEQINDIVESLYRDYAQKRRSFDEIFEEFVCDVMADMNDYAEIFSAETREYWAAEEQDRKGYSPSTYTESIDAGGENGNKVKTIEANSFASTAPQLSVDTVNEFTSNDNINISQNDDVVNSNIRENSENDTRINTEDVKAIQSIPKKSVNDFTSEDIKKTENFAKKYYSEMGEKSPFFRAWFGDWRANDTSEVAVADKKGAVRGATKNLDTGWDIQISGKVFNETKSHSSSHAKGAFPYLDYINSIVENAVLLDSYTVPSGKAKSSNSAMMHSLYAIADMGNGRELVKLYVEELNDVNSDGTIKRAYQLQNITKAPAASVRVQNNILSSLTNTASADTYTVSQLFELVKSLDKNFKPNEVSKVVNEDGTPKVMYHGSSNDFSVFDLKKAHYSGTFGKGFYFTDSNSHASTYGNLYEVYLDVKNPVTGEIPVNRKQLKKFIIAVADNEDYSIENYGTYDINAILNKINKTDLFTALRDINSTAIGDFAETVKLYNRVNGTNFDGVISATETVVFDSNQIKSATDNIGTFDKENNDIRFSTDENTDVNVSDDEDMSYLSEPVKNIRNDINEVISRADLKKGGKVYDRAAAVRVRDSILDNISIGDIQGIDMRTKKDRAVMTVLVNRALNSAGVDAKRKSARDLTRYIAQNASVYDADSLCADGGVDYEGDRAVILNYIKHGVKISPDAKEAIISAVGENSARGYIAMMSNNSALGIDSVYDELSVALPGYFTSDALTEGEKMRRVIDVYTWLKDGKSMQDVKLIDVMTPDDARAFTELVQKQLELAFDTMGRDSAISREIAAERTKYEQRLNDIRERYEVKIADMRSSAKKKQSDGAKAKNISTEQTGNRFKNLAEAAKKYGAIKKGANAVRDIEMPKRIDDNRYVSRFARTMAEAGVTPDESLSEFERDILDGKMTYERITDEEAKKSATDKILRRGFMQILDDWNEMILSNQRIGKNEMALGQTLYNQCINAKDAQNAMKIAADLANIATQAGQTVQACMLIKQMSPDCQLYSLEQSVEKMKNEFENKRKFVSGEKRKIDLKINEELAQKLLNAKTEDERRAVMDEILQDIANQIPSTLKDKWDSWRYLSMLGNPRTHIRNIGGNAVFMLPVKVKNAVGWVLEKTISKDKRTKSLKSTKDSKNFAAADYAKMKDIIQGSSGKYEELSKINELRRIYKFKPLEWLRKANFAALEWEDGIFLKHHYVNAMAQFLTARGYTSEFMNSGTKDAASVLENARTYAMSEAQKATYRDANAIAETLSRWQRNLQNNDKLGVRVVGQAVEGIVPFKKTPLNIAKRGVEYSPIGLISGLYDAAANIKSGKVTAAQAIDKIASGLTGTGLVILGMGLSKLGLVKGDDDDDDKLARLDSATGEQSYSFKIGNHSYTIDWVAPASMPFFMGVSMQNAFDKTDKFTFEETLNAVLKIPAPLLNLSVLSSLNDLIRAGDYSSTPTEKMADYVWQATTSYVGQAFPTVMGQIARTVDKTKRNASFTDPDNGLPAGLDRFIARQTTKIPGLSKILEPKIDMWGREETYGDTWYGRLIGNTISPGYYKEINSTVLDDELRRLGNEYEGDGSVLPPKAPKYFTYEKQKYYMTPSEYARYSVIRGQKSFEAADELIRTDDYKNKSAAEKKKALEKCYDAAGDEAKNEILKGRGIDVAAKEAEKAAAKKKTKKKSSKKKKK